MSAAPPVVIIMGPPGSGKSTQAKAAAARFGFAELDTGGLVRDMKDADGPLGDWYRAHYATGRLAPPPLIVDLVMTETRKLLAGSRGLIFHGSPRTLREAEALARLLVTPRREGKNLILALDTPKPEIVRRILERGKAGARTDDTEEGMEQRWEEYRFRTDPALNFLAGRVTCERVDGHRPIREVSADVQRRIAAAFHLSP